LAFGIANLATQNLQVELMECKKWNHIDVYIVEIQWKQNISGKKSDALIAVVKFYIKSEAQQQK